MKEGSGLKNRSGKIIDIAPSPLKFLGARILPSRKVVFANAQAETLQHVIDLAESQKLAIPIARTLSLADAPAVLATLERGERLNGKAVILF